MALRDPNGRRTVTAPELLFKLVLTGTQTHYEHRGVIDDKRLEHLLFAGKQILYKSHQESDVRQNLGFSPNVWQGLTDVLTKAVPVLEQQSFSWRSPTDSGFTGSSSDLIATNYLSLVKDIERLNDLCTIARNLLATTKKAQNLAAEKAFDQQILKLIDVCVRVTARGFDGETNARNEERWQKVVNLYKRLLITCLQFLHNFIMHNEHRKLVLWLDLFGQVQRPDVEPEAEEKTHVEQLDEVQDADAKVIEVQDDGLQTVAKGALGYNIDDIRALFDLMQAKNVQDGPTQEAAKMLMDKIRNDMERLSGLDAGQLDANPEALHKFGDALRAQLPMKEFVAKVQSAAEQYAKQKENVVPESSLQPTPSNPKTEPNVTDRPNHWSKLPDLTSFGDLDAPNREIGPDDLVMPRTSRSAAETLQEAKDELMARLKDDNLPADADEVVEQSYETNSHGEVALEDDLIESVEDDLEEEEEEDEDEEIDDSYSPGDQERGLLTDVPLVLGPTEIEALPMIIQAGIVDTFGAKNGDRQGVKNMQAVRCHILLAQEAGRNLLRELLIFIAAWDLPDDEFYFKMMVQIMEAILKNGLMSHAYADFGQAKDIISPAQAVVIKILTHIFRAKYSPASIMQNGNQEGGPPKARLPAPLSRVDVLTVRYIFSVFRGNIIPETCALIYLQGQIRDGRALADDFPLNLWDMERVYEGVYQFLEFFAVLTENNDWKRLLVSWEIVYDLVTLIKELDASIPKASLIQSMPPPPAPNGGPVRQQPTETSTSSNNDHTENPITTERPYDLSSSEPRPLSPALPTTLPPPPPAPISPPPPVATEDPADFEWRNLKKLIVLVLSSLVWKSKPVQDQIRQHGGVEVILGCTQYDGHNPYIKEHAVMCLKFLLEGNKENQDLVGGLEAREVVGGQDEVRDMGVEVGIDDQGKVRILRGEMEKERLGMGRRRASDGNVRERFGRMDIGQSSLRREETVGRVIGEDDEN